MKAKWIPVLISVVVMTASAAAQETAKIAWKPEVGRVTKYKLDFTATMSISDAGEQMTFQLGLVMTNKITKILEDKKIVLESTVSNMAMSFGGQEMPGPGEGFVETVTFDEHGEIHDKKTNAPDEMQQARLEQSYIFIYPNKEMKVGDTWKRINRGDEKKHTVACETEFKFEGTETIGKWKTNKVSYTFRETVGTNPMTASGTVWVSAEDGELVKADYSAKNIEFQPGAPLASGVAKITRTE